MTENLNRLRLAEETAHKVGAEPKDLGVWNARGSEAERRGIDPVLLLAQRLAEFSTPSENEGE